MYRQGDVVLVPVPFTDLTTSKRRPVLILSNDGFNAESDDVIVVAITSNIRNNSNSVIIESYDMEEGEFPKKSCIKIDKIYTLAQSIVIKKIGKLKIDKRMQVYSRIVELIS